MPEKCVGSQHLRDTYGAAPTNVVIVSDFDLAALTLVQVRERQEQLNLLLICLQ